MRLLRCLCAVALASGNVLDTAPAGAQRAQGPADTAAPSFNEGPCPLQVAPTSGGPVRCGEVTVPLDHDDPGGATIRLAVAVVPAAEPQDAAPLVMLGGGRVNRSWRRSSP